MNIKKQAGRRGKMRRIKKYPNGRMYDTVERKYLTPDLLSELIDEEGADVLVFDSVTGEDITSETVGRLQREKETGTAGRFDSLVGRIGKRGKTATGRMGKYLSLWRDTFSGTESAVTETEDTFGNVRNWMKTFPETFRRRIVETIDRRLDTVLGAINLATRNQVADLADKIAALDKKIERLERQGGAENISHANSMAYTVFTEPAEKRLNA
jgi:polyhydroxyalkanoate synthesis regulator protein